MRRGFGPQVPVFGTDSPNAKRRAHGTWHRFSIEGYLQRGNAIIWLHDRGVRDQSERLYGIRIGLDTTWRDNSRSFVFAWTFGRISEGEGPRERLRISFPVRVGSA